MCGIKFGDFKAVAATKSSILMCAFRWQWYCCGNIAGLSRISIYSDFVCHVRHLEQHIHHCNITCATMFIRQINKILAGGFCAREYIPTEMVSFSTDRLDLCVQMCGGSTHP